MSNHNYISDMARAYNDLYGTACTLEEKLRESERNLGALEWENEILRELLAGPEDYNVAEEDGGGDVDCGTCKEEEEGSPIAVILSQNPYVDCEGRNIKGEIWSSRADDGRHSPNTSPASGFEDQKPMTTIKSGSETSEVDKKPFQRSNAPSPDENCYREQHGEAAREKGRADFRQIQTEMAILDLIALVEKLEDRMDVLGREVDGSDVGLRGGMGARDEEEEFVYDYGGYTNWDEVEAQQQKAKAKRQASKEKPKLVSSDGGIQKPALLNVGLSEDSKSINGTLTTLLQTRNQFLESELQAFKEMNESLVQDRNWQMSMQIELEERLEAVEAERDDIFCELRTLRKRCERLMESTGEFDNRKGEREACDENKRLSGEKMRGGNEESKLVSTKEPKAEGGVPLDSLRPSPISSRSLNCTNESFPSFASSPAGTAMSFEFFPEVSTIVIGSDPPHIYQFPHEFTLPQIRELLESVDFKEEIEGEKYVLRILEIMRIREDMGVELPNTLREERVSIGIPDVSNLVFLNNDSKLAAWQTFDTDAKSLGTLVQQGVIGSSSATGVREALPKASSSDRDVYQNISTLINSLNELDVDSNSCGTDTAVFCTCTLCTQSGRETYFNIRDMQPSPTLNVRGGGDDMYGDSITQPSSPGSPHLSPILSPSPSLASRARLIFSSRCSTGTVAPKALILSSEHEIANAKEPLSIRLGDFLFPASLVRDRENSIRHFNWRDVKRMNPQCKNKCSKGFRYKKHPRCEGWASQLDRHREFCDCCQAIFIEEEYEKMRESEVEDVRHEYDASKPFSEVEKPWKKSTWPDDTHKSPFPVVQEPDPRLRGGAGHEHEMGGEEEDPEDWKSEWHCLATQAQGTKHLSRTFRNSSTLSTKSLYQPIEPIEPIVRDFGSRWRLIDGYRRRFDAGDGDVHQSCEGVLDQGCLGESARFLHDYHHNTLSSDSLLRSKTANPALLRLRSPRGESGGERRQDRPEPSLASRFPPRSSTLNPVDRAAELRAEYWLDNPRTAPLTALKGESPFHRPTLHVRWHPDFSTPREPIRHIPHPSPPPSPSRKSPFRRCSQLLALLLADIMKLKQRLRLLKQAQTASTPASTGHLSQAPAPTQTINQAFDINTSLPVPPSSLELDKSLPPTPHISTETIMRSETTLTPRGKSAANPQTPDPELPEREKSSETNLLERAYEIAKAKDGKCAKIVGTEGTNWRVPTLAGPVDLVQEAVTWLIYEAEAHKRELD